LPQNIPPRRLGNKRTSPSRLNIPCLVKPSTNQPADQPSHVHVKVNPINRSINTNPPGTPPVLQSGYDFDFHWRYCAFNTASTTRANGCSTKNGVRASTLSRFNGLFEGVRRRIKDKLPQSCTSPERVKTISDFRKFDSAKRVVMVRGRIAVDDGIG
jgi:hypothetical protein